MFQEGLYESCVVYNIDYKQCIELCKEINASSYISYETACYVVEELIRHEVHLKNIRVMYRECGVYGLHKALELLKVAKNKKGELVGRDVKNTIKTISEERRHLHGRKKASYKR